MEPYRVLVVDDSAFMRKIITDLIEHDPQFVVVGTAKNGIEAVTSVDTTNPDVITLDLEMPQMNGIDALQHILKKHRLPIIMLSGISEANTRDTIKALQYGAFDFIRKPSMVGTNAQDIRSVGEILLEKLKIAVLTRRKGSNLKQSTPFAKQTKNNIDYLAESASNLPKNDRIISKKTVPQVTSSMNKELDSKIKNQDTVVPPKKQLDVTALKKVQKREIVVPAQQVKVSKKANSNSITSIVAIGTSTGGPKALHEVISHLPGSLAAPVVIVQHMPPRFTKSLAQRLDHFSELEVCEAEHGMKLQNGKAYVAPGGYHMKVERQQEQYVLSLSNEPPRNGHRPSVDVLFDSLLEFQELERHIVLMTGMGSDGAQGMKKLADQGVASTIAEAEESCVVYGMPRSAVELGAASKVLPLSHIAPELMKLVLKN